MENGGYYIDLETFTLDTLKQRLSKIHLTPSQKVLVVDMDARFAILKGQGIENLKQLQEILKNKKAVAAFAEQCELPIDYLTVLRRWVNGYHPKPIKLADFPTVDPNAIAKLEEIGIKNTLHLFPRVKSVESRAKLGEETGITAEDILLLAKFTDLVRLKWVGAKFAHLLLVSGFDTVEKVAKADGEALYAHLQKVNSEHKVYQGGYSLDDIRLWVAHIVCDVPITIKY